jgi:ubiquinone/menaquinone biosynthesis C-methylase UbiE
MIDDANTEAIEAWNTILFDKFVRFRHLLTTGLAIHGDAALERSAPPRGARVLDVGCGFGDTTVAIAQRVGEGGEAVGVDAAARFIEAAAQEAKTAGVSNARFLVADVQTDPLGGPYDMAYSRFGTMFFASPVAAFRNVRRSLKKGGTFTMVVWRKKEENPFLAGAEQLVLEIVPHPQKREDDVTCGPGPFSLASTDVASAQLVRAGFARITFERFDTEVKLGRSLDEAVEFALALGPSGEILRLAREEGERKRPAVVAALRDFFAPMTRADGVWGASSSWIVTAEAS